VTGQQSGQGVSLGLALSEHGDNQLLVRLYWRA
jgi:hypothetical protein